MRVFFAFLFMILFLSSGCKKITEPIGGPIGNYSFSFTKGNYWSYAALDSTWYPKENFPYVRTGRERVSVLRDTVLNNGQKVNTIYCETGDLGDFDYVRFAHDSLCFYSDLDGKLKNLFLFPLTTGRTWTVMNEKMEVIGQETIKTKAGEFQTFHVKRYVSRPDYYGETHYWIANHIGIVKRFDNLFFTINKIRNHGYLNLVWTNVK